MSHAPEALRVMHPLFQAGQGGASPTSALSLHLVEVPAKLAIALNRLWHSVLPDISSLSVVTSKYRACYGAHHGGLWYATAIWTHPIASNRMKGGGTAIELRRLAIAPDAPKNTASRMLGIMARLVKQRFPELTRLVSYQAKEHHEGTIYKAAGWVPANEARYVKWEGRVKEKKRKGAGAVRFPSWRRTEQTGSPKVRWEKWFVPPESIEGQRRKSKSKRQLDLFSDSGV